MGYNYVQVGQENSFTWSAMEKGFTIQTERLAALAAEGKVRIETLGETGRWFKETYPLTPPTSVITTEDTRDLQRKTLWFNSRNYRANLLWEGPALKFRDIHLFDESLRSEYLDKPDTLPVFRYETLPLVDGCLWSAPDDMAALRFVAPAFTGGDPVFSVRGKGSCQEIRWPSAAGDARFVIDLTEDAICIAAKGKVGDWCLELKTLPGVALPFTDITPDAVKAVFQGVPYGITLAKGKAEDLRGGSAGEVFRIIPESGRIEIRID